MLNFRIGVQTGKSDVCLQNFVLRYTYIYYMIIKDAKEVFIWAVEFVRQTAARKSNTHEW